MKAFGLANAYFGRRLSRGGHHRVRPLAGEPRGCHHRPRRATVCCGRSSWARAQIFDGFRRSTIARRMKCPVKSDCVLTNPSAILYIEGFCNCHETKHFIWFVRWDPLHPYTPYRNIRLGFRDSWVDQRSELVGRAGRTCQSCENVCHGCSFSALVGSASASIAHRVLRLWDVPSWVLFLGEVSICISSISGNGYFFEATSAFSSNVLNSSKNP